ncbi:NUDIX hydrolase [Winogradskyella sp. A3E31]|uniref:NUDIX hydrolase n=1 Tax=Winogradskyella sp. A3E31 TaxID=3349637 RepID=UPI00398BA232
MDELIDIVDKQGHPTGRSALKSVIHKQGLYHSTIHLWLYTNKGEILLQQRSHKKPICPLLWDVSVAGHIDAGETEIIAAIRETKEEIGLSLEENQLKKIGTFLHESEYYNGSIKDNEFHQVYISELKVPLEQLIPQEDEVEALKLVSTAEFKSLLKESEHNSHFVPSNRDYYEFVVKTISKELDI